MSTVAYFPRHARALSPRQVATRTWGPVAALAAFVALGVGVHEQAGHLVAAGYTLVGAGATAARATRSTYHARHARDYTPRHSMRSR